MMNMTTVVATSASANESTKRSIRFNFSRLFCGDRFSYAAWYDQDTEQKTRTPFRNLDEGREEKLGGRSPPSI